MKRQIYIAFIVLISLNLSHLKAEYIFGGYLSDMPSLSYTDPPGTYFLDNLLHNRLNLKWLPSEHITASISIRNRLMHGQSYKNISSTLYQSQITFDNGYADLTHIWTSGNNYLLLSSIDRLWLDLQLNSLQIRIGRQRINWGQSMVWNPNDIFNAYNYFDFDYPEKPGSDAIRLQYYTGNASLLEGVTSINHYGKATIAARYRFNAKGYDIQLLSGFVDETDVILGAGWSGNISNWGLYGEMTAFLPKHSIDNIEAIVSIGTNKNFENSLFLQAELLYSSNLTNINRDISDLYNQNSSYQNLSISDFTSFLSLSYPVTSLLSGAFTHMCFFRNETMYLGPSLEYSLTDNIYVSGIVQIFVAQMDNNTLIGRRKTLGTASFIRLKWSF